jgi:peroxiredoxin family protein
MPTDQAALDELIRQRLDEILPQKLEELRSLSKEADVKFIACQMTVELFGFSHDDFIEGIDYAGAATFLPVAQQSDVCLFM